MIERHVTFTVIQGKEIDFEAFLDLQYLPAMSAQPGFKGAVILREEGKPNLYKAVLRFESFEAASNWRASQVHIELSPVMKSFYSGSEVLVYEVRITR